MVPTDVTSDDQVKALAAAVLHRFGGVDALIANSGIGGPSGPLWELDREAWEETFAVNVTGMFLSARAFLPSMLDRRRGSIVVIGSMTGKRPLWGRTPYAASKLALVGLVRTLAVEEARAEMVAQIPIGRLIEPREVADAVVSLTLGKLSAVTGADLNVNGGMVMY